MKKTSGMILMVAVIGLFSVLSAETEGIRPLNIEKDENVLIQELKAGIPRLMERAAIPGLSIAVIRGGEIVWASGFGVKSMKTAGPVTNRTVFEAASLSKVVFAYAVLKLVDRGVVNLDHPLVRYLSLPEIKDKFSAAVVKDQRLKKITARMVLSHSCGFPNWRQGELKILFEPGEKFSYSGEGFVFLQRVVEKLTGKTLEHIMKREVFEPLGMNNSSYVWSKAFEAHAAKPHKFLKAGGVRKSTRANAAATLMTTAPDYARFVQAIMRKEGLKRETHAEMLTAQIATDKEKAPAVFWGLGVGLQITTQGRVFWHWGDNEDYKAFFAAFEKGNLGVVYFANCWLGLSVIEEIVALACGGDLSQVIDQTLEYPKLNSPVGKILTLYVFQGVDAVIKTLRSLWGDPGQKGLIQEEKVRELGNQIGGIEDKEGAFKIFSLNREFFPESYQTGVDLARAHLEKGNLDKAKELYLTAKSAAEGGSEDTSKLEWPLSYIKALKNPASLSTDLLNKLAGVYETRHIRLHDGSLEYFRDGTGTKNYRALIPLSEDTFVLKDLVFFRIQFKFDKQGNPEKILGLYEWGRRDESERSK